MSAPAAAIWVLLGSAAPVGLDYQAPPQCPDRETFVERVRHRASHARFGEGAAIEASVVLSPQGQRFAGFLALRDRTRAYPRRVVEGNTCDDVATALALMLALTFKGRTGDEEEAAPPSGPPAAAPDAPRPVEGDGPPLPPLAPEVGPPAPLGSSPVRASTEVPEDSTRAPDWRWSVGLDARSLIGVFPGIELGVPVFLDVAGPRASLRVGVVRASGETDVGTSAKASFAWTVGWVEACPLRFPFGALVADTCLRLEGGALRGAAEQVANAGEETRPWLSLGAGGRIRWVEPEPLYLELEAGVALPLLRHRFFLAPSDTIHRVAPATPFAGIGIGFVFS